MVAISLKLVAPRLGHGTAAFMVTTVLAGGLSLAGAWFFAKVFELPFQRHRSWAALVDAGARRPEPRRHGEVPAVAGCRSPSP